MSKKQPRMNNHDTAAATSVDPSMFEDLTQDSGSDDEVYLVPTQADTPTPPGNISTRHSSSTEEQLPDIEQSVTGASATARVQQTANSNALRSAPAVAGSGIARSIRHFQQQHERQYDETSPAVAGASTPRRVHSALGSSSVCRPCGPSESILNEREYPAMKDPHRGAGDINTSPRKDTGPSLPLQPQLAIMHRQQRSHGAVEVQQATDHRIPPASSSSSTFGAARGKPTGAGLDVLSGSVADSNVPVRGGGGSGSLGGSGSTTTVRTNNHNIGTSVIAFSSGGRTPLQSIDSSQAPIDVLEERLSALLASDNQERFRLVRCVIFWFTAPSFISQINE